MNNRSLSDYGLLILKGIAMGIANKIPGVSGGIVAVVTGFYKELIFSFQRLNFQAVYLLFRGRFSAFWQYINGSFLFVLLLGIILSYFSLSLLLDVVLGIFPHHVWAFFFGLVLASAILLFRNYNTWHTKTMVFALIGLTVGVGLSVLSPSEQNASLGYVFLCGVVSVVGMTLPGLSGSFLLILMGNYTFLLVDAVNGFGRWIVSPFIGSELASTDAHYALVFGVFLAGSFVGISGLSSLIHRIQQKANNELQAIIIGFVFGSLFILWPTKRVENLDVSLSGNSIFWTIFWGIIGLFIVFVLDYYERKK
ncbi:MAG: DUF368 domain-containing protein [Bacteroidetes bacterium]|nr:DUF368 domain-containing protein [Bacteroidota bacterium]MDA0888610.1 DUF368 domain-containing protein [Bacteroidota bacterium]MDA1085020.1 DUF368 domain-containing protein [Bacteroidota bacterium]